VSERYIGVQLSWNDLELGIVACSHQGNFLFNSAPSISAIMPFVPSNILSIRMTSSMRATSMLQGFTFSYGQRYLALPSVFIMCILSKHDIGYYSRSYSYARRLGESGMSLSSGGVYQPFVL